ncbi:MAG: dihydroorotase [Dehalococcoidales bacterium]|nr:dihydroorotase [Dehalococcoidales bacterium]
MESLLIIQGGRLIDPAQNLDSVGNILITEGKIALVGKREILPEGDYEVLPAKGLVVCAGFIDLHCHLRTPGFEEKETIASGTKAAAAGGFTTVCCMPNTNPPLDSTAAIRNLMAKTKAEGAVRVLPIACITRGRQGKEMTAMAGLVSEGVVGFSDDGSPVLDNKVMRSVLEWSSIFEMTIIDHCEDTALTAGGVINQGKVSQELGLPGIPASAEETMIERDIKLVDETAGSLHITHVSTANGVELIRKAKKKRLKITADVTPHHLTLTEEKVKESGTMAKVNPPLRTAADVDALIQGLREGTIDCIATDHAPHTEADKPADFAKAAFGISGFETALAVLMELVRADRLTLSLLIAKLTREPAKILGNRFGKLGGLNINAGADITIFDPDKEWTVDPKAFASKGKNTPWAGMKLKGKVMATIFNGKVVYKDESIVINAKKESGEKKKAAL